MKPETIQIEMQGGGIAVVALNRPEVHNAFDERMIAELTAAFRELDADPLVRVVVLAGKGKHFCAGGDLNWMRRTAEASREENLRDALAAAELMHVLDTLGKPTVARVQGAAFGGGVGLAACSDIAVAADSARFCLSEVRLGLLPSVISPYVVRAIGVRQARRYALTAEQFTADDARRIGLIHEVVPAGRLSEKVGEIAEELLRGGPTALAGAKALIAELANRPPDQRLREHTADRISAARASGEGREGISAFLEKRRPQWRR